MSTSISLTTLPPELFNYVAAGVESPSALANLAQSSRQISLQTIPHLYHHVTVHEQENQRLRLPNLASLLIRRPELAGLVRNFTFLKRWKDFEDLEPGKSKECMRPETVTVDQMFKTAVNAPSLSKKEEKFLLRHLNRINECHYDLILALLLPFLLKMKKLVLDLEDDLPTPHLHWMMRRAARREKPFHIHPPFEALTAFVYINHNFNPRNTSFVPSLLTLPAIQIISEDARNLSYHYDDKDNILTRLKGSSSRLTSLNLIGHELRKTYIRHILQAPEALKTFSYTKCSQTRIDFTDIRDALMPQKNHLERMGFNHDERRDIRWRRSVDSESLGPMRSFIGFNTLKVFKTAAVFLEKTENGTESLSLINIFPTSLETLHLTCFQIRFEGLLEALEHLLAQKSPQQIPLLTTLILEESTSYVEFDGKLKDALWKGTQDSAMGRLNRVAAAQCVSIHVIFAT